MQVLQVAAPLELNEQDPEHLRDTQTCQARSPPKQPQHSLNTAPTSTPTRHQNTPTATPPHSPPPIQIFWNCVVTEAVIQFLWSGTSTSTATECYDENVANSTVPNGTAANAHRALAHRGEAGGTDRSVVGGGCTAGNQKIVTMVITGMFAAACLITTAVVCRIAFRLGNQPTRRRWVRVARHAAAWAFNLGFWAGGCWVIAAYGSCMGREETDEIIIGSLVGFGVSWMLMEPLWIVLITLAPCVCDTRLMRWMNDRANDIGLDLSLLLG